MNHAGTQAGLRIGLFAHRLAGERPTGIGRYFRQLVCALGAESRDQRLIVASTRELEDPGWIPPQMGPHILPWPRQAVQLAWCLGTGPRLERALGTLDVAHLLQPFPPVVTAAPQVVTVHDLFPLENPEWCRPAERWTYRPSLRLVARRAARIVAPSSYVADRVQELLQVETGRVAVVPLGVSGIFSARAGEPEVLAVCHRLGVVPGRFAVCVGSVSTRKNVVTAVRAVAQLGERVPLVIIGPDGQGVEQVDGEIARLEGRARIVRAGYLPDGQTAALVQSAAALLHPALGEGFGLVPLEAMAAGTPVIAARTGSIPEVVDDAAVLVDEPENPEAWARALTEMLEDALRRDARASAGLERARRFSWGHTARRMIELYEDVARTACKC